MRCWAASTCQIVETVYEKLHNTFGLRQERPHDMAGLRARLAARVALHKFCIWLNYGKRTITVRARGYHQALEAASSRGKSQGLRPPTLDGPA